MAASRSRLLLHRIALVAFVALLATGIALRDLEAIAFAVGVLIGVFLLPVRNGVFGRIVLALVFADTAAWMVPAAISNTSHGDDIQYVALPVGLAVVAVAGLAAAVGIGSRIVTAVIVAAGAAAVGVSQVSGGDAAAARAGDIVVEAKNVRFKPERLSSTSDDTTIVLKNRDLFWHTLTIDELDVDIRVPVGATRRATFDAAPGEYEYYCAIPGHDAAGMEGTLVVS